MYRFLILLLPLLITSEIVHAQSSGFVFQTEQGISALNNFNRKRDAGAFGGYAASLGAEYRLPSGIYFQAAVQRLSARLEFNNNSLTLNSSDTATLGPNQAYGSTWSKEYRFAYGVGAAANWKTIRFSLDLAHSVEFNQRAETIAVRVDGLIEDGGDFATSRYREAFNFRDENWKLVNNSNHQLQLTGSIAAAFSSRFSIALFYRTDLLTRWVELRLQDQPGQTDFVLVERRDARQAVAGLRLTYGLGAGPK
jgi:hypothetical protein